MAIDYDSQAEIILNSDATTAEKIRLLNEIRKALSPNENRWNFRLVIVVIGLTALSVPVLCLFKFLSSNTVSIPTELITLSSTALGALAAYLMPNTQRKDIDAVKPAKEPPNAPGPQAKPQSAPTPQTNKPGEGNAS